MKKSVLPLYEGTARKFSARAQAALGDELSSVVLYGSVARRTAGPNSDIDVLVLTRRDGRVRERLVEIAEGLDFENRYETFVIPASMTPEHLERLAAGGFPFGASVVREGVVLYDDGTFERIREGAVKVG